MSDAVTAYCPECGPVATCDADGLCLGCGCTVFLSSAPWFLAALAAARVDAINEYESALRKRFPNSTTFSRIAESIRNGGAR